jgi:RNA polymerase sigma-70 factor (ECF subfamily)
VKTGVEPTNGDLIQLAKAGDQLALGQLLQNYRNYLRLLARLRIKKHWRARFDASDVVQDSLLKAFRAFESFRGHTEDDLLLWLRGILVNSLCDVGRRSERSNYRSVELKKSLIDKLNDSSVMLGQRLVDHYTPSKSALEHEQSVQVANVLEAMPAKYRDVIILRHLDELRFPRLPFA